MGPNGPDLMSLSSSISVQFPPVRRSPLPSTHSLALLTNNNYHQNNNLLASSSLEPVRETTPLTNGGPKLKKATVPVPNPRRSVFREQLPSYFSGITVFSVSIFAILLIYIGNIKLLSNIWRIGLHNFFLLYSEHLSSRMHKLGVLNPDENVNTNLLNFVCFWFYCFFMLAYYQSRFQFRFLPTTIAL